MHRICGGDTGLHGRGPECFGVVSNFAKRLKTGSAWGTTGGDRYRSFGLTAFETPTGGVGGFGIGPLNKILRNLEKKGAAAMVGAAAVEGAAAVFFNI